MYNNYSDLPIWLWEITTELQQPMFWLFSNILNFCWEGLMFWKLAPLTSVDPECTVLQLFLTCGNCWSSSFNREILFLKNILMWCFSSLVVRSMLDSMLALLSHRFRDRVKATTYIQQTVLINFPKKVKYLLIKVLACSSDYVFSRRIHELQFLFSKGTSTHF